MPFLRGDVAIIQPETSTDLAHVKKILDPGNCEANVEASQLDFYQERTALDEERTRIISVMTSPGYQEYAAEAYHEASMPFANQQEDRGPMIEISQYMDVTSGLSRSMRIPEAAMLSYWRQQQMYLKTDNALQQEAGEELPDFELINNLKKLTIERDCSDQDDRFLFEVLQETTWAGNKTYRPVQLVHQDSEVPQAIHHWVKCSIAQGDELKEIFDDLSMPFAMQKKINLFLQERPDRTVHPADVDLSPLNWSQPEARRARCRKFGKSFRPLTSLSREMLYERFIAKKLAKKIKQKTEKISLLTDVEMLTLYKNLKGSNPDPTTKQMVDLIVSFYPLTAKWKRLLLAYRTKFDCMFPVKICTLRTLRDEFVRPMQEEMRDKLMSGSKAVGHLLDSATHNAGFSILDLIDIKTSDLKALNLSEPDELELRDSLLSWAALPAYDTELITIYAEEAYENELEDEIDLDEINMDDMETGDFEEMSLEPDQKAKPIRDTDAFTYSACGGNVKIHRKCSLGDASLIRACRDANTLEDLKFFKSVHESAFDASWEAWKHLQDVIEYTAARITA